MMMYMSPMPQLEQLVAAAPRTLMGIERLNIGYKGPVARVRRAFDNVEADCYSQQDIANHCGSSNGFIVIMYDQSRRNLHFGYYGATSAQPKVYDGTTGLVRFGRVPMIQFSGAQQLWRNDKCGFALGSPPITSAIMLNAWSNTAPPNPCCYGIGDLLTDVPPSGWNWYLGRPATTYFISTRLAGRNWTQGSDPGTGRHFLVNRKALDQLSTGWTMRQNKVTLTESSVTSGALNFASTGNPASSWGNAMTFQQPMTGYSAMLVHYDTELTGAELNALEQVLERMRTQL